MKPTEAGFLRRLLRTIAWTALVSLATAPLSDAAQAQADPGLEVKVRALGGDWKVLPSAGPGRTVALGQSGLGTAIDGIALKATAGALEYQVLVDGAGWQPWKKQGEPAGTTGQKIGGLRIRTVGGYVRYRVSFLGVGYSDWREDGRAFGRTEDPLAIDALEVEYLSKPKPLDLEYRARFRDTGFTPWVKAGQTAEGKGPNAELVDLQIRSTGDVRYELSVFARGFRTTAKNGQSAGYAEGAEGKDRIDGVRIFGGRVPLRYRLRLERDGWTNWESDGNECGEIMGYQRIQAIEIRPDLGLPADGKDSKDPKGAKDGKDTKSGGPVSK